MCKLILSAMQITERNTGVKRRLENVKMTVAWLGAECCDRTYRTYRTDDKDNINTEVDGFLKLFDWQPVKRSWRSWQMMTQGGMDQVTPCVWGDDCACWQQHDNDMSAHRELVRSSRCSQLSLASCSLVCVASARLGYLRHSLADALSNFCKHTQQFTPLPATLQGTRHSWKDLNLVEQVLEANKRKCTTYGL